MQRRWRVAIAVLGMAAAVLVASWLASHGNRLDVVHSDRSKRAMQYAVELRDGGGVAWVSGSEAMGAVAANVPLTRSITLVSRCTQVLTGVRIAASCGCTHVSINKTRLSPGEHATLTLTYDASKGEGPATVSVVVMSTGQPPPVPHRIRLRFDVMNNQGEVHASAEPRSIVLDEPWRPHIAKETTVRLRFSPAVDLGSVQIGSPDSYVQVDQLPDRAGNRPERSATVRVVDPPPGNLRGRVSIRFVAESKPCELVIPISGMIRPRYTVSPQTVSLGTITTAAAANVELEVLPDSATDQSPRVRLEGDWVCAGIERTAGTGFKVRVGLGLPKGRYVAGRVLIGGDLGDPPVAVPLSAILDVRP